MASNHIKAGKRALAFLTVFLFQSCTSESGTTTLFSKKTSPQETKHSVEKEEKIEKGLEIFLDKTEIIDFALANNISGQTVHRRLSGSPGKNRITLSSSNFQSGTYIAIVRIGKKLPHVHRIEIE